MLSMEGFFRLLLLTLAFLVVPSGYVVLCLRMQRATVPQAPYLPFFFVFGTVGGWCLGLALSPSGPAALSVVFLATLAPLALLGSAAWLWHLRAVSPYHRAALYSSLGYCGFVVLWLSLIYFIVAPHR